MSWACGSPLAALETHPAQATASGTHDPRSNRSKKRTGPKLLTAATRRSPRARRRLRAGLLRSHSRSETIAGERLDRPMVRTVPGLHKAVTWNQPYYAHDGG
jgi:hypothetical protein